MIHEAMGAAPRDEKPPQTLEDLLDRIDVPAAVVCARCGSAECPGCEPYDASRSGVIAIVAWERREGSLLRRLWLTARSTTRDPEAFFEALPDGPLGPALGFAVVSELVAAVAMIGVLLSVTALVAPLWLQALVVDAAALRVAARILAVAIPTLAVLLVLAHAAHGLALDVGARRSGARPARTRALRFGLYAAGWDLVLGPAGALAIALTEGVAPALAMMRAGVGLPGRSARAFLRGAYQLHGAGADRALRVAYVTAIVASLLSALVILAAILAVVLLPR